MAERDRKREEKINKLIEEKEQKNKDVIQDSDSDEEDERLVAIRAKWGARSSQLPWDIQQQLLHGRQNRHDLMAPTTGHKEDKASNQIFKRAKKTFPMFPSERKELKWDSYGEPIDPADYEVHKDINTPYYYKNEAQKAAQLRLEQIRDLESIKKIEAENLKKEYKKESSRLEGIEYSELDDIDIFYNRSPTKYVVEKNVPVDIRAEIVYIDFDGRADWDSCARIVQQVSPRELLLIGAEFDRVDKFIEKVKDKEESAIRNMQTHTPTENGQVLNATRERNIYQVKLLDSLVSKLSFQKTRGVEVSWIDGNIRYNSEEAANRARDRAEMTEEDKENLTVSRSLMPTLDPLPETLCEGHEPVFINDVRLTDFKITLKKEGFIAEFVGGMLIVNQEICLKRSHGNIEMEGMLTEDYYRVRDLLYSQYALV